MNEIESFLRPNLERQLLKYAVGRAITCPYCGNILDVREAVLVDTTTLCRACFLEVIRYTREDTPDRWPGFRKALRAMKQKGDLLVGWQLFGKKGINP